jgi:hypothetical protein
MGESNLSSLDLSSLSEKAMIYYFYLSKPAIDPFCLPSVEGESYLGLSVSFFALRFTYFVTHGTASGKLILRSI